MQHQSNQYVPSHLKKEALVKKQIEFLTHDRINESSMEKVLSHMENSKINKNCTVTHCSPPRQNISHSKNCERSDCTVLSLRPTNIENYINAPVNCHLTTQEASDATTHTSSTSIDLVYKNYNDNMTLLNTMMTGIIPMKNSSFSRISSDVHQDSSNNDNISALQSSQEQQTQAMNQEGQQVLTKFPYNRC